MRGALPGRRRVGVDRGEQDLTRAELLGFARPFDGVAIGRERARVRADAPALRVDRNDDRLRPEPLGELGDQLRSRERGGVHADLVRARLEQALRVVRRADAAADRERDREPLGDALDELDQRRTVSEGRLDVEEDELVGARIGVRGAQLDRVADVAQALEPHALDDAPRGHVEARDQTRERDDASSR
jgi:hypothetical protein